MTPTQDEGAGGRDKTYQGDAVRGEVQGSGTQYFDLTAGEEEPYFRAGMQGECGSEGGVDRGVLLAEDMGEVTIFLDQQRTKWRLGAHPKIIDIVPFLKMIMGPENPDHAHEWCATATCERVC